MPKSLSELRAPGEPSKLLFLLTWPGENSDFCFLRGLLGGLIWHISVLEYLREPIVQHQNHYITCFETCLPLSPGTFEIASTQLS